MTILGTPHHRDPLIPRLSVAPFSTLLARRLGILTLGPLEEVVQALPTVRAIRWRFPLAHITWMMREAFTDLMAAAVIADEIVPCAPKPRWRYGVRSMNRSPLPIGDRHFDVTIDMGGSDWFLRNCFAVPAATRIGLSSRTIRWDGPYSFIVDDRPWTRSWDARFWAIAEALGAGDTPKDPNLYPTSRDLARARSMLHSLPRPIIAVHPHAWGDLDRLALRQWVEAIEQGMIEHQGSCILIGDDGKGEFLDRLSVPCVHFSGTTHHSELSGLFSQIDVLATQDLGLAHLAASVGTPTVSLLRCETPSCAAPRGARHQVVHAGPACRGSLFRRVSHRCLVDPVVVARALRNVLFHATPLEPTAPRAA